MQKMSTNFITLCCFMIVLLVGCSVAIKEGCRSTQEDWMTKCHVQLPVLTSPDIPVAMTQEELDKSCIDLQGGIRCVQNFTEHCMEKHEQVTFRRIYRGITDVVQELCQKGKYQEEYLKHATCIKRVRSEYEECSRRYERTLTMVHNKQQNEVQYRTDGMAESDEEQQVKTICCSFQEYLQCSEQTVLRSCGDEAALFTSEFLKRMASNINSNFCMSYRDRECSRSDDAVIANFSPFLVGASILLQGYRAALVPA